MYVVLMSRAGCCCGVCAVFRSEKVLKLLEDHIYTITSRINTYTGVAYKEDPTIIGYNLFNEPRWVAPVVQACQA